MDAAGGALPPIAQLNFSVTVPQGSPIHLSMRVFKAHAHAQASGIHHRFAPRCWRSCVRARVSPLFEGSSLPTIICLGASVRLGRTGQLLQTSMVRGA